MTTQPLAAPVIHLVTETDPETYLEGYRRWLAGQGLARNTLEQRVKFARARLAEWGSFSREPYELAEYLDRYAGWSRRTYLNHLRSIYTWLLDTGQLQASPLARYRTPKQPRPRPNPLTQEQVDAVLSDAPPKLRAWLMLGLYAGLRCHEIAKFRGEDINENLLRVVGKGGVDAVLPTHPELWALAQQWPREGWWFPSPRKPGQHVGENTVSLQIRAHFRRHQIEDGGIHRTRHTYGTQLARAGVQPRIVQELMRHSSLETTAGYIAVSSEERAEAIRVVGSRS